LVVNFVHRIKRQIRRFIKKIAGPLAQYYLEYTTKPIVKSGVREFLTQNLLPDDVVVEVGAYMGASSIAMSNNCKWVYSFEPNNTTFRILRRVTRKIRNIEIFNFAAGSVKSINYLAKRSKYSVDSVCTVDGTTTKSLAAKQQIEVLPLDEIKFHFKPTVLVSDCEGYETEVLKGGRKILSSVRLCLVEIHTLSDGTTTESKLTSELKSLNFWNQEIIPVGGWRWMVAKKVVPSLPITVNA
jgi:FkbM family methyltransferase